MNADIGEGHWDAVLERGAELKAGPLPPIELATIDGGIALVLAWRGDDEQAMALMAEAWEQMAGVTKHDDLGWTHLTQAEVHFAAGRWREGIASLLEAANSEFFAYTNLPYAACYALLLRDRELVEELAARIAVTTRKTGRTMDVFAARGQAAITAMRGDLPAAAALYRHIAEEQRDMGLMPDVCLTNALTISTFGVTSPAGQAAYKESRQILEPLGANGLLARLEDVARQTPLAAEAGSAPSVVGEVVQPVL